MAIYGWIFITVWWMTSIDNNNKWWINRVIAPPVGVITWIPPITPHIDRGCINITKNLRLINGNFLFFGRKNVTDWLNLRNLDNNAITHFYFLGKKFDWRFKIAKFRKLNFKKSLIDVTDTDGPLLLKII